MVKIPQYTRSVTPQNTGYGYVQSHANPVAFGIGVSQAVQDAGGALGRLGSGILELKEQYDKTKVLEASNELDKYINDTLYDKDNGYFYKTGKEAMGKSSEIMENYDKYADELISKSGMNGDKEQYLRRIAAQKRIGLERYSEAYDKQQSDKWQDSVYSDALSNVFNKAINGRNNPLDIDKYKKDGFTILDNYAVIKGWYNDPEIYAINKKEFEGNFNAKILDAYLADGSLKAREFFEKNKENINPELHSKYIGAIKDEENKYKAKELAAQIISSSGSEKEAIQKAESLEDVNMSDSVLSRIKKYYSQEEYFARQQQEESLKNFYEKAVQAAQAGTILSYDDIPYDADPDVKLSLMNYINKNGQQEDDSQVWQHLYEMKVNNAQGFASEDLNKYRGFLSESEFRQFQKDQQNIQKGDYYTIIKDDNAIIDEALEALKLNKRKKEDTAYSEMRSLVREFEARRGRKITDLELQNLADSLGFKGENGVQLYKLYEKGMAEKTGFIKSVVNDFVYYQSKHNGELPSDSEKYKIVQKRLQQKAQENKTKNQTTVEKYTGNSLMLQNISSVTPKPNEQKVLTWFADNQVPEISQKLGLKLTVTSRYRNQKGSHHSEGRACDISLSEHNNNNKIKIYEEVLKLPTVHKIGCSDPLILFHFKNNPKIADERIYDKQHGTNHVNHMHVTLINYNPQSDVQIAADKQSDTYRF